MEQFRERGLFCLGANPLAVGIEQQSGGKGSNDIGQADQLGDKSQREAERQSENKDHAVFARPGRESDDVSGKNSQE